MAHVIAVDLDGTLAHYDKWRGIHHIGAPIPLMLELVKGVVDMGTKVVIFTARAYDEEAIPFIETWLKEAGLPKLEITNIKRKEFTEIWDDRAVSVKRNAGVCMNANALNLKDTKSDLLKIKKNSLKEQVGGNHYRDMKIQPVEFCHANNMGGIESAVVKYVSRYKFKNGEQDIDKAIHLLQLLKQLEYNS